MIRLRNIARVPAVRPGYITAVPISRPASVRTFHRFACACGDQTVSQSLSPAWCSFPAQVYPVDANSTSPKGHRPQATRIKMTVTPFRMFNSLMMLAFEANVVALRTLTLMRGGTGALHEAELMVREKIDAAF